MVLEFLSGPRLIFLEYYKLVIEIYTSTPCLPLPPSPLPLLSLVLPLPLPLSWTHPMFSSGIKGVRRGGGDDKQGVRFWGDEKGVLKYTRQEGYFQVSTDEPKSSSKEGKGGEGGTGVKMEKLQYARVITRLLGRESM